MPAILILLAITAACLGLAYAVAGIPGTIGGDVGAIHFEAPISVALVALVVLIVAVLLIIRLLGALLALPTRFGRRGKRSRLKNGDRAVTAALMALAAGDTGDARREASRAKRLLGPTPQVLLIRAEAERAAGLPAEAATSYEVLASRKDSAFLGLRGLAALAVERRDFNEARILIERAERARPSTPWARQERLKLATQASDWQHAATLADGDAARAGFMAAAAGAETDPKRALKLAREAHRLAPGSAAAALVAARLFRTGRSEAKAAAILRETWRVAPDPELASAALEVERDPVKRVAMAEAFVARGTDPVETHLLLGQVCLDASMVGEAKRHAQAARAASGVADRRVLTLIAEIAGRDTSLSEPERRAAEADALRDAAAAPPGPRWRCSACAAEHPTWTPICTSCGTPGRVSRTKVVPDMATSRPAQTRLLAAPVS